MLIENVDINILKFDPNNARKHNEKNLLAIKGSINRFGIVEPLVVRRHTNVVIGGNGRLQVLLEMGTKSVPVHYVDLDDRKAMALGAALNRTSELAEWDMSALGTLLHGLREEDFDLNEIGFDVSDLDTILVDVPPEPDDPSNPVEDKKKLTLTVVFDDDEVQQELFLELRDRGFKVKSK